MFRYLQASNSQADGIVLVQSQALKLSASAVVVQQEVINQRLEQAEDRLRAIASASRSPLPVMRQLKYQTVERAAKPDTSQLQIHVMEISRHLKQIEQCWQTREFTSERQYELKYLESVQRCHELQVCHSRQVAKLENTLKQQEELSQLHIKELAAKHTSDISKLRAEHQLELQHVLNERREELRQQHLTTQSTFLARENQLINEIELLESTLEGELEQHAKTQARLNEVEQQHIKEICRLQTRVDCLENQIKRTTGELLLEKSLKLEGLTRLREMEQCLDIAKRNNQRFSLEVNQLKGQVAESVHDATEAYQYLERTLMRIAALADRSSATAAIHIREEVRSTTIEIQSLMQDIRRRYSIGELNLSHVRSKQPPPTDRLSELISVNKENLHYQCNISADFAGKRLHRKTRSALQNCPRSSAIPRAYRPIEQQTYHFLLIQAQQIESLL